MKDSNMSGTTKRAFVYSPYFQTAGGGEVYALTVAEQLKKFGYRVVLAANPHHLASAASLLSIDTSGMESDSHLGSILASGSLRARYKASANYDLGFVVSDGSIPFVFAKKNLLHFQVPFSFLRATPLTICKLLNQTLVCNSHFTASIIASRLKHRTRVLYPPLRRPIVKTQKKPMIVSVGRFGAALNGKQQEKLLEAFRIFLTQVPQVNYTLVLIGTATSKEAEAQLHSLRALAKNSPVEILPNCPQETKDQILSQAQFYWHATGMGQDPRKNPEKVEHFGIAIVEAMSAGCVPVVTNAGGPVEIITPIDPTLLVSSPQEMATTTARIAASQAEYDLLSSACQRRSLDFSLQTFSTTLNDLV